MKKWERGIADLLTEEKDEWKPVPFWSWNDKLDQKRLKEQIRWMKKQGIGGFFMHARSGLKTEYLSDDWMNCIVSCADEAEKLQMKAWIYDENGWPSGFAGGKLLREEKNRDCYLKWEMGSYDEKAAVSYKMEEKRLLRVSEEIVSHEKEVGTYLNVYIHRAVSTADILNPEVVDLFLQFTHEKYRKWFGDSFCKKIEGFFTDEPQYQRWNTPYTPMIAAYFQEKYEEDILDSLGLLFVEKEGWRRFRYRYWKGMQHLMLENFAAKVYGWCKENGVKLTGHYVEETTMGFQLMCCGGVMPFYEYEDIPGIDWLGKGTDNELSLRQVASAAAQLGKEQVLSETFGCCGWDVTPAELQRIAGYQYVNGVNLICHHLVPYSERGRRKYDYPAHYAPLNPWISEGFPIFNEYFRKLGSLLEQGRTEIKVAMLHPMRSAYFDYKRELEQDGFGVAELDRQLKEALRTLSVRGIDFHLLDETLLEKYGFVEGARIGCKACAYDYLVLPHLLTMDVTTEALLRKYVEQGGKVLLLGEKPIYLEAEPYDYAYLNSNFSLEDLMKIQPYQIADTDTELYIAYRTLGTKKFLYVVNASETESYTQTFECGKEVRSFVRVDLSDESKRKIPLTITLEPGENALLFFCEEEPEKEEELELYEFRFTSARAEFRENYLPIDEVFYSTDGKEYVGPWPIPGVFQKLLQERYEGVLYIKYCFEIEEVPEQLKLRLEDNHLLEVSVNGVLITGYEEAEMWYMREYRISHLVLKGQNVCVLKMMWHQQEQVYFTLFGENVTESLKNCVEFDSELQPIELIGKFGVYPKAGYRSDGDERYVMGDDFYIGKERETVADITVNGFPFFSGEITLSQTVLLQNKNVRLKIPGNYQMGFVTVNGRFAGRLFFSKELDISRFAVKGENKISVRFLISNRNRLGPHHYMKGRTGSVSPYSFELMGTWKEGKNSEYHSYYDLQRFYLANG